ncbi:hypothetical protein SDC9_107792 [bioreactor metagenome]|uniref:Uncharacterized protein n=1 Tax=bioreactor metagenome TaxID=1076179 RepID=A0A645B7B2_9ZZZZ|nr:hypothetical protein [Paludibacter sp.]
MKTKRNPINPVTINPLDFDFNLHKGRFVKMNTVNGIQYGTLMSFIDNMITLKSLSKNRIPAISQFDYSEVQTIILN